MFLDHTQRRTTVGRTPLDEWSAPRRDLYLTTHDTHNRQTSMPAVGFEPTISAGERPQTYAVDRAATGTDMVWWIMFFYISMNFVISQPFRLLWTVAMPPSDSPTTISPVSVFELHNYFRIHTESEYHLNSYFLNASVQKDSSFEQGGTSKRKQISRRVALKRHNFAPIWTRMNTDPYSLYMLVSCRHFDEKNNAYCAY